MATIKKYACWIALALTLITCVYAYFNLLLPLDVFLWDESHHGFYGLQIYHDLQAGDWELFWQHTNNQALWMPLHSWLDALFLSVFGFSYAAARASSLFLFFLCALLIFLTGRELAKEQGWVIGLIAVGLFLTSPILLSLATLNMQEMLGVFILLTLYYFMIRFMASETAWKYAGIGFLLSLAYWSKSNFALQAILGVGLFQLSLLWGGQHQALSLKPVQRKQSSKQTPKTVGRGGLIWLINNVYILAGFLPLFLLWWLTPPWDRKYALGFMFRTQGIGNALFYPSVNFFGRVWFYVQSLISSYSFSLWVGLAYLAAIGFSFALWGDKKIRLALLLFLANLFMISLVGNIQERYLSTAAPLVFLLLAVMIVVYAEKIANLRAKSKLRLIIIMAILSTALIFDALSLTRYTKEVANRSGLFPIYTDCLNQFTPPFLFGLANRPTFTYPMDQIKKLPDFKQPPKSSLNEIMEFFSSNIKKNQSLSSFISYHELSPYVVYWHFHDWQAQVFTGNDAPIIGKYFWMTDYFIDLQPAPDSTYAMEWLDKSWDKWGPILLKNGLVKLVASKECTDLGLTAYIYKREKAIVDN